jgi:hypothetical protein
MAKWEELARKTGRVIHASSRESGVTSVRSTYGVPVVNILAVVCCRLLLGGEAFAQSLGDVSVFDSRWNYDSGPKAAGYDFSKTFERINRYAEVGAGKCFVLGRNRAHEMELGLLCASEDGKELYSSVMRYPSAEAANMMDVSFAVLLGEKTQRVSYVIIKYTTGNVGTHVEETQTFIDVVCSTNTLSRYGLVHREKVGESVVWWRRYGKGERGYLYLAPDHSTVGPGDVEPARQSISDIFIADINTDGFPDIVIHRRSTRARKSEDARSPDFVVVKDEMLAMIYESTNMRFAKPVGVTDSSVVHGTEKMRRLSFERDVKAE